MTAAESFVSSLTRRPRREFADRLAVIPEAETVIDNNYYDLPEWASQWLVPSSGAGQLVFMNSARAPYFERIWRRELPAENTRMLDVGCGGGLLTNVLAAAGFALNGVDISPNSLEQARIGAANLTNKPHYEVSSAYDLPYANESFDGVVMSDVLEHFHDLRKALSEVYRVLKPGGAFVLDTINRTPQSWVLAIQIGERLTGRIPPGTHDWRLFIKPAELEVAMRDVGLLPGPASELVGFSPVNPLAYPPVFAETPGDVSVSYLWWGKKAGQSATPEVETSPSDEGSLRAS